MLGLVCKHNNRNYERVIDMIDTYYLSVLWQPHNEDNNLNVPIYINGFRQGMYFNCIFDSTQGAFDLSYFIGSIHFTMYTFLCVGCGWFSGKGEAGERAGGGRDWMGILGNFGR